MEKEPTEVVTGSRRPVKPAYLGYIGLFLGAVALLVALVQFTAGPFTPTQTVEAAVVEKAVAIRDAAMATLKGESASPSPPEEPPLDVDRWLTIGCAVLGGLALILAVFGFAREESLRPAAGAAFLGVFAVAFQYSILAAGVFFLGLIIALAFSRLDFGQ